MTSAPPPSTPLPPCGLAHAASEPHASNVLAHMRSVRHLSESHLEQLLSVLARDREQLDLRFRAIRCVLRARSRPDARGASFIELRDTCNGPRHFLGGRFLRAGDVIECCYRNGYSVVGVYEWDDDPDCVPLLAREDGGFVAIHPELELRVRFVRSAG